MTIRESEKLLESISDSFGFTKEDFRDGKPIYTKWGADENGNPRDEIVDIADLGHRSFKISKNLGDIYIDTIHTDEWVIVGEGTTLHCDDLVAGKGVVTDFKGFLM